MVTSGERREWDSESSIGSCYHICNALFLKLFGEKISVHYVILCTLFYMPDRK